MKTKIILLCLGILTLANAVKSQRISPEDLKRLMIEQDTLADLSYKIVNAYNEEDRVNANYTFIPALVRSLKIKNSFYFPYDSIQTVSILYPTDSTFRIFTWALARDNGSFRHFGTIQMNTKDGSLKMFPLFDNSDFIRDQDTITNHQTWYGCLYYRLLTTRYFNKNYYTLMGWDGNNIRSNKKMIEMLSFDDKGMPVFGAHMFSFIEDTLKRPVQNRFILEYKKNASVSLNYNADVDMIVYDHLVPEDSLQAGKKYTYVSDLDYEAFKWKAGKWVHVEKPFSIKVKQGQFPVEQPLDFRAKDSLYKKED